MQVCNKCNFYQFFLWPWFYGFILVIDESVIFYIVGLLTDQLMNPLIQVNRRVFILIAKIKDKCTEDLLVEYGLYHWIECFAPLLVD